MHFNRRKFSGASKQFFLSTSYFWGSKKAKINFFEEKWDLSAVFYQIEVRVVTKMSSLTDMEKHKMLEMLLKGQIFTHF